MRMIAGPNGSGKSTAVREHLRPEWLGYYLNPDDIQKDIVATGYFDFASAGISASADEVLGFFGRSSFLAAKGLGQKSQSFTFESVKSSKDKIQRLSDARQQGYRTYLYFIATEDPEINVDRVRQRVRLNGHPVPENKVRERYVRSLDNLLDAIRNSNRAYIFDNSSPKSRLIAEISDEPGLSGEKAIFWKTQEIPVWFYRSVLAKLF